MRIWETSASEPLMRRRKELNGVKTGGSQDARMSTGGTCRLHVKGKAQVRPHKSESTDLLTPVGFIALPFQVPKIWIFFCRQNHLDFRHKG